MSTITTEVTVIVALLLLNGVLAMSELAIVSARRFRLERRAQEGDTGAAEALRLARHPAHFLSGVQVGITLIGVLSGAFGGATIAAEIAAKLERVPPLAPYREAIALGLVVAAITYLSLVIGELVPKRVALAHPEAIAARLARPVSALLVVFRPLVALLAGSTNLVLRALRVRAVAESAVSEDEIRALVEEAAEGGEVQAAEQQIVESAFRLGDRTVASIMTPRVDVEWLDVAEPDDALRERLTTAWHARWLVCDGGVERVVGIVRAEELFARSLAGSDRSLADALRAVAHDPAFVPDSMPVYRLLEQFRSSRAGIAVVLDEFGGVQGLVTLDDLLEGLVGDYVPTAPGAEPSMVQRADGSWLIDGILPIAELEGTLELGPLSVEGRRGFRTVAGFLMAQLGRLPVTGDVVECEGFRFEVVDMDGRRVDKVLVASVK